MTSPFDVSVLLFEVLEKPAPEGVAEVSLVETLGEFWYSSRGEGCFFRLDDEAFEVRELQAFRDFVARAKIDVGGTFDFAILDYWLPSLPTPYINAIYLAIGQQDELKRYAQRLTTLYKTRGIREKVFDTNKIMASLHHYAPFTLSRSTPSGDELESDYFVNIAGIHQLLLSLAPDSLNVVLSDIDLEIGVQSEYINALEDLYNECALKRHANTIRASLERNCSLLVRKVVLGRSQREVAEISFGNVQSAFVTYVAFFLSIMPSDPREYVYFPVRMVASPDKKMRWVGGLFFPFVRPPTREVRTALENAAQVIVSNFYVAYTEGLLLKSLTESAQAQIMSRNMSHNIGSHALARIRAADMIGRPEDSERLLQYLQERMDFVARVATEWPAWREPVLFFSNLIQGFLNQGLLLDNLVADDGYDADHIAFSVVLPGNPKGISLTFCRRREVPEAEEEKFSEYRFQDAGSGDTDSAPDVLVAIPGGPVGRQALFGFLENALRNAAKHNPRRKSLKIFLELKEDVSAANKRVCYSLRYQDSVSLVDSSSEVVRQIQDLIARDLVNPMTRQPVAEAWGIQEMKVYAEYLAHTSSHSYSKYSNGRRRKYLFASGDELSAKVEPPRDTAKQLSPKVLTYTLEIQRPCLALLAGASGFCVNEGLRRRYGLELVDSWRTVKRETVQTLSPGLLYINCDESEDELMKWLLENQLWLPARVLLRPVAAKLADQVREKLKSRELLHRVRIDADEMPLGTGTQVPTTPEDTVQHQVLDLYRRWIKAIARERGFPTPFNIIVYFDRDAVRYPQRWQDLGDSVLRSGLARLIRGYPVYHRNVLDDANVTGTVTLKEPWKVVALRRLRKVNEEIKARLLDTLSVDEKLKPGTWLVFDNHGEGDPGDLTVGFYQYIGGYSSDQSQLWNNRDAFDRLTAISRDFVGILSLIQLVEASLSRILILDERVVGAALQVQEVKEGRRHESKLKWCCTRAGTEYGDAIASYLSQAGISFTPFFNVVLAGETHRICVLRTDGQVIWDDDRDRVSGITVEDGRITRCVTTRLGGEKRGLMEIDLANGEHGPWFDAVIVHRGLLGSLSDNIRNLGSSFAEEQFMQSLRRVAARVILTSGRGTQLEGTSSKYPFLEFSVLERYVLRELSKPSLGNVLMAVTGRGGENE